MVSLSQHANFNFTEFLRQSMLKEEHTPHRTKSEEIDDAVDYSTPSTSNSSPTLATHPPHRSHT